MRCGKKWLCAYGCTFVNTQARPNVYSGRKMWWGHEVYGKRYGGDELRVDTEKAMVTGGDYGLKG